MFRCCVFKWTRRDSNPQPSACKAVALPIAPQAHLLRVIANTHKRSHLDGTRTRICFSALRDSQVSSQLDYEAIYYKSSLLLRCLTTAPPFYIPPLSNTHWWIRVRASLADGQTAVLATLTGLEPVTFCVTGRRPNQLDYRAIYYALCGDASLQKRPKAGRNNGTRTHALTIISRALYQLSYAPFKYPMSDSNRRPPDSYQAHLFANTSEAI